jgi:hypothetical protein
MVHLLFKDGDNYKMCTYLRVSNTYKSGSDRFTTIYGMLFAPNLMLIP